MAEGISSWAGHSQDMLQKINALQQNKVYPTAEFWKNKEPSWYRHNDARVYGFIGLARATNNLKMSYLFLSQCSDVSWWESLDADGEVSERIIQDWLSEYETFISWAYILNVWTNIEETFRLIYAAQGKPRYEKIGLIYNKILKEAGQLFYSPLLEIWRLLKNMHHNNGIYLPENGRDRIITWKNREYAFKAGQDIGFYTPQLLVETLTADLCDVLNQLMLSPAVLAIPSVPRSWNSDGE